MANNYLLTGNPGTGKTNIIKQVLTESGRSAGGFYTEEIKVRGKRQGFKIVTLQGDSAILAHIDIESPYKVGKYGVNVESLEKVAVPAIRTAMRTHEVVIIDEIGKMELFSRSFRKAALESIESRKPVLGTIMLKSHPWADKIKYHPSVKLVLVDQTNRLQVFRQVFQWMKS